MKPIFVACIARCIWGLLLYSCCLGTGHAQATDLMFVDRGLRKFQ